MNAFSDRFTCSLYVVFFYKTPIQSLDLTELDKNYILGIVLGLLTVVFLAF